MKNKNTSCNSYNVLVEFKDNPHLNTLLANLKTLVSYCKIHKSKINNLDNSEDYNKFYNKVLEASHE